jgi:predicted transcriptional regulator
MQNELNSLQLSLAILINEIKKQPDPFFEDLSTALSLYRTIHEAEKEIVELYKKYIPQFSKTELFEELTTGLKYKDDDYKKYAPYLIEALFEYGGARKCEDAIPDIISKVSADNKLGNDEFVLVNSETEVKGYNRIRFIRNNLKDKGYIVPTKQGGKHGVWELTDKGKNWCEKWNQAV